MIGSRAYVEGLDDQLVAYLNIDMAGSPAGNNFVYDDTVESEGSSAITQAFVDWLTDRGEPAVLMDLGNGSDHAAFSQAGIPTGGLFAGATETGGASQPSVPQIAQSGSWGTRPGASWETFRRRLVARRG